MGKKSLGTHHRLMHDYPSNQSSQTQFYKLLFIGENVNFTNSREIDHQDADHGFEELILGKKKEKITPFIILLNQNTCLLWSYLSVIRLV